jgi:hypothetical protein
MNGSDIVIIAFVATVAVYISLVVYCYVMDRREYQRWLAGGPPPLAWKLEDDREVEDYMRTMREKRAKRNEQ